MSERSLPAISNQLPHRETHIPALDGVRGLAILLVLLHHCYLQPHPGAPFLQLLYQVSHAAWAGVDLFFVLSGFLITGILFDSLGSKDYFPTFYKRRVLRIFPLYFAAIGLALACTYPLHLAWHGRQWLLLAYLQNVGLRPPFDYQISRVISFNHFWSLAVEEQYYLAWPLVVFLLRDARRLMVLAVCGSAAALALRVVLAAHGVNSEYLFTSTPTRADALLMGGALSLALRSFGREPVQRALKWLCPAALAAILAVSITNHGFFWPDPGVATYGMSLTVLWGVGLIALSIEKGTLVQSVFSGSVLRFFGRYSYGLYVWHIAVFSALKPWYMARYGTGPASALIANLLCIAGSIVVAVVSYRGLESPFLRLKGKLAPKQADRRRALAAT